MGNCNGAVQTEFFFFSETLACTLHKDAPFREIETAVGTVLSQTGDWE